MNELIQAAARRITVFRALEAIVKEQIDDAKTEAYKAMQAGAVEKIAAMDDAGAKLASVSLSSGRTRARVFDERALLEWVKRNHPGEVMETVRPSFLKALLDGAVTKADPDDDTAIGPDGEVLPGVELSRSEGYVSVTSSAVAKERMRALLASSGLLALPAGNEDGEVADRAQD